MKKLAESEQVDRQVVSKDILRKSLFGDRKEAKVILSYYEKQPVGFALFLHNFSTFLGRAGIYLYE